MQSAPDFDPARLARSLLRCSRQGALATLKPQSGAPYCSLVNLATHPDNSPVLLISRLAVHTINILGDPRVSLMLDERTPGEPLEGARIMVGGLAEVAENGEIGILRHRYLNAHPSAEAFVDFEDFSFYRVRVTDVHLVAGFGRIVDLPSDRVLTDLSGAETLLDAESEVIAHMNADHSDTINLYATKLLGADSGRWRCAGCDPDGMDFQDGFRTVRLEFPRRIVSPAALRHVLKELALQARTVGET